MYQLLRIACLVLSSLLAGSAPLSAATGVPLQPQGSGPVRWLVPAYGNPDMCCDGGFDMWNDLITLARARPDEVAVIFNPNSGPGTRVDLNYQNDAGDGPLPRLLATNAKVLGYVTSSNAAKNPDAVIAEIRRYYQAGYWRGTPLRLDGIFLDQVSADLANVPGYRRIRDALRVLDANALLIGNPGQPYTVNPSQAASTAQQYAALFDALVVFEGHSDNFTGGYVRPLWAGDTDAAELASIVYGVRDPAQMRATVQRAVARGHRWVYVTDDLPANPYDYLSRYWMEQLAYLRTLNANPPTFVVPPGISGNWSPPNQSGHGFQFEMIDATTVTAFWFTFDNAGNEVWILGVGRIAGNQIHMDAIRTRGGRFPPNFNPASINRPGWGTLDFTFASCDRASVRWNSTDAAFTAAGSLDLQRLTSVVGTACE